MAIGTDSGIWFFNGTPVEVTSGTPATIATTAYGKADQGATVNWTNADDAPYGAAVLKAQFDTAMPTVGNIRLMAHCLNIQSTNDPEIKNADYPHVNVGSFPIPFGVAPDVDFYTHIPFFQIPMLATAQAIDWYIHNNGTGQTIGVSWQLWIEAKTYGPHA